MNRELATDHPADPSQADESFMAPLENTMRRAASDERDSTSPPAKLQSRLLSPFILVADDREARLEKVVRLGALLFVAAGVLGYLVTALPGADSYRNARGIGVLGLLSLVSGLGMFGFARYMTPPLLYSMLFASVLMITLAAYFAGPESMAFAAMIYTWQASFCFCVLKKRWVVPPLTLMGIGWAVVLWTSTSPGVPLSLAVNGWLFTMITVIIIGTVVSVLVQHLHEVAMAESVSRSEAEAAQQELFLLNRDLEDRVKAKVLEVERLSTLRRLASSHVADALLDSSTALDPHRREIAVFFVDLRGFTRFAMDSDPEEVIQVLDEFYLVLGRAFIEFEATVGAFEADGVMAYFNDPMPVDNPAQRAVDMALNLCDPLNILVERWRRRGFDLHFGIGIALGFATMGMVGFEGRQDYTAIGNVVNLASRLCAESQTGAILIDRKVRLAISDNHKIEDLEPKHLKGFRDPVPLFRLIP